MAIKCGVYKTTYEDDEAIWQTKVSKFWIGVLIVALLVFPFAFQGSKYLLHIADTVLISIIAALGLNLLTGFTGQISLGHGAFIGVGAYASGYLMNQFGVPFIGCLVAAGFITAIVGMIFGIPSLRLKGLYLAIATLAAQVILEFVFIRGRSITGGSQGLLVSPASIAGFEFDSEFKFYFLALFFAILAVLIAKNIVRTKPGRAFMAIRDRYISAESSSAGESHPHALTEPDVNLSAHPAPIVQPLTEETANGQTTLAVSALCALSTAASSAYGLLVSCISSLPTSPIFGQSVGRSGTLLICSSS